MAAFLKVDGLPDSPRCYISRYKRSESQSLLRSCTPSVSFPALPEDKTWLINQAETRRLQQVNQCGQGQDCSRKSVNCHILFHYVVGLLIAPKKCISTRFILLATKSSRFYSR